MKFQAVFSIIFLFVIDISSRRIGSVVEKFDRERYERSRNRPKGKPFNLTADDEVIDFVAIVNAYGYPAEEHTLKTVDGYKIRIHRIPGSPSNLKTSKKPVVFMHHGLFGSSDIWVLMGPTHDLAYMLADVGLDVWIGNARGNTYSRKHISLDPDYDADFWQYSFHEIALYDVTVAIDYILNLTNQENIIYIGHSMGTVISYILLSEKPEYNEKMKLVISLSPAAFWHSRSNVLTSFLVDHGSTIKNVLESGKIHEVFPLTGNLAKLGNIFCANNLFQNVCLNIFHYIAGFNSEQVNTSLIPHILKYGPAGASAKTVNHFIQNIQSGNFRKFDYGVVENVKLYKQKKPPSYNLSNIVAPIALFYGKADTVIPSVDVIKFSKKLRNLLVIEAAPDEKFNHADFLFARDLKELLNDRLMEIITKTLEMTAGTVL